MERRRDRMIRFLQIGNPRGFFFATRPTDHSRNSGGGAPASRAGFAVAGLAPTKVLAESPSRYSESNAPV